MKYQNYTEKIEKLKEYLGDWPPPFDPPECVQISTARCGSNSLYDMVRSFFKENKNSGHSSYEWMDTANPDSYDWSETSQKYFFYNIFDIDPHRLHFPLFFWMLQHCEKVVFLIREDHFTRPLSLFYADLITDRLGDQGKKMYHFPEIYREPINLKVFAQMIRHSIINVEVLKRIINRNVDENRLHRIEFASLYHYQTLNTLGSLIDFLGEDPKTTKVSVEVQRETYHDAIPNLQEILDIFHREDASEHHYWAPENMELPDIESYNMERIHEEIEDIIRLHAEINQPPAEKGVQSRRNTPQSTHFQLDSEAQFYLSEIPETATYLYPEEFGQLPNLHIELYLSDRRWEIIDHDYQSPSHITYLFDVVDINANRVRDYSRICGFSVFFLKRLRESQVNARHRIEESVHQKLIEGVKALITFPERCPETLLRFYVAPDAWERIHEDGLFGSEGVEFYKMAYDSEDSQFGAIWRHLALFDKEFEWAIETDVAKDEAWIFARIAEWGRYEFEEWLENSESPWAGEYLISVDNYPETHRSTFSDKERIWNVDVFDFMNAGGIVTRPKEMPPVEAVLHRYIDERPYQMIYYHQGRNVWTQFPSHLHQIPHGWEGWGCDQAVWAQLKRALPGRHIIHQKSLDYISEENPEIPQDYLTRRIFSQLIREGNEFIHYKTYQPVFTMG